MSQSQVISATNPPQPTTLFQTLKQKLTWKTSLLLLIPTFLLYPRPFLYILSPLISRIRNSYTPSRPKAKKIFFSPNKQLTIQKLIRSYMPNQQVQNVYQINLYENDLFNYVGSTGMVNKSRSSDVLGRSISWDKAVCEEPTIFLSAQNAVLRVKMLALELREQRNSDYILLIKGSPQLLRIVEAKLYGMDSSEYFKIPFFQQKQIHVLELCADNKSYEQITTQLKQI